MGNQACAKPCALYKKCTDMKQSGIYEGDILDITSTDLSENPQDAAAEYDRFVEVFDAVTRLGMATPNERKEILQRARRTLSIDSQRSIERKAYHALLEFNQKVDAFKRRRRNIIDSFLLSVSYSPCSGRRHEKSGRFNVRRREICQSSATNHEDVRSIIATDKAFCKDLAHGVKLDVAKCRFETGGYGL